MRILFITSTRVGDAILSTGLLDHLITKHPGARITVACGPAAAGLFAAVPNLENLIVLDKMVLSCHWLMLWARCATKIWDLVVDLRNAPVSYLLAARTRRRMGRVREPVHRVRQLARVLDLADSPPSPRLWIADHHYRAAEELIPDGPPAAPVRTCRSWTRCRPWRPA